MSNIYILSEEDEFEKAYEESILPRLAEAGYRIMHRRNGQYWVMFPEPMTIWGIDQFLSTGFVVLGGEPGHIDFNPVPDNEWRRANGWGAPGSRPLSKRSGD
jgi:hypothetical protein